MTYQTIELTKEGRLATLTLNRPNAMNAMDDVMMKELAEAFESLQTDESVQVLLIHGAGKAFSAGGDINLVNLIPYILIIALSLIGMHAVMAMTI